VIINRHFLNILPALAQIHVRTAVLKCKCE